MTGYDWLGLWGEITCIKQTSQKWGFGAITENAQKPSLSFLSRKPK